VAAVIISAAPQVLAKRVPLRQVDAEIHEVDGCGIAPGSGRPSLDVTSSRGRPRSGREEAGPPEAAPREALMLPTLLVVGNAEAMKRLVVAGLGSALTSSVAVRDEARAGLLKSYPAVPTAPA